MPNISIITNCHTEGNLTKATLQSVNACIEEAKKTGISTEWLIVRDNPDKDTKNYIKNYFSSKGIIFDVNFNDPGLSRNYGASVAKGEYIAFIDADDLWGINWLTRAYSMAQLLQNKQIILHPQTTIFFETINNTWLLCDQEDALFDLHILLFYNCWTTSTFAKREIYLENPYPASDLNKGFGYEDWHWNCETTAMQILHKLVSDTFHCFRVKAWKESLLAKTNKSNCIIKPSKLFALKYQRNQAVMSKTQW